MQLQEKQVFVVAERSANHRENKSIAPKSVRAAAGCGVDAIKIQTYTHDTLKIDCANPFFAFRTRNNLGWKNVVRAMPRSLYAVGMQPQLKRSAEEDGLGFFSSPFD
jgi:pseudaminic acid synthase